MKVIFFTFLRICNIALLVLLVLSYLSTFIHPDSFLLPVFVGMGYPFLAIANVLAMMFWGVLRDRMAFYNIGAFVLGWGYFVNTFGLGWARKMPSENKLVVVSHNNLGLRHNEANNYEEKKDLADDFLEQYRTFEPDVLCLQEANLPKKMNKFVDAYLEENLGLAYHYHQHNYAIHSRFPIQNKGDVVSEITTVALYADIKIDTLLVRFYSVHLQSNHITADSKRIAENLENWEERPFQEMLGSVFNRVGSASGIRADEADLLREHIEGCRHPIVVCGDFNSTPVSYPYAKIRGNLQDTFHKHGIGINPTYAGKIPFLRIDYILPDRLFKVISHTKVPKAYSDHHPVVAVLKF